MWAFGVVMYEILEGKLPYYLLQNSEVPKFVCDGGSLEIPTHLHFPELWNIAKRCLERDPSKRPSFDELFQEIEQLEAQLDQSNPYGQAKKVSVNNNSNNSNASVSYQQTSFSSNNSSSNTPYSTSNYHSNE